MGDTGPRAGEDPTRLAAPVAAPGGECGDGVGGGVPTLGDADDLAGAVLVGLGAADGDQDPAGSVADVDEVEAGELGAAHRGGEPEQDERGIAGTLDGGAVKVVEDPTDLGGRERAGLSSGCGADQAPQPAPDLADRVVDGRVRESVDAGADT